MNRRSVLSLAILTLLLLAPNVAIAQNATPAASPVACSPQPFCKSTGFVSRVWRTYAFVGLTFTSPELMQFGIAEFDNDTDASASLQTIITGCLPAPKATQDRTAVSLTSMDKRGDESLAISGPVIDVNPSNDYFAACFAIRTGKYVRFCYAWGWTSNPLSDALNVVDKSITRMPSQEAVTTTLGVSRGGLWDAVPTLEDLPTGYHVTGESQ